MKLIQILSIGLLITFSFTTVTADDFSDKKEVKLFIQDMVKKHNFDKTYLENLFKQAKIYDSILEAIARPA
ncbi:MAG: hypothetical protein OEW97_08955, partial [Gammaproteobacteria bacterium]|nr:hypothetical protein [Gammaproteobacteria bacterium]